MTYNEMKPGIRYRVTRASDDGTFEVGCHISRDKKDGTIIDYDAGGWLEVEYIPQATIGMECEIDQEWLARRKEMLKKEIEELL